MPTAVSSVRNTHPLDVVTLGEAMAMFVATESGDLAEVETFTKRIAGAELNVSIGLARLGLNVGWVSRIGNDAFGRFTLQQLLFVRKESEGHGVVICCTTTKDEMPKRREFFNEIVAKAKFDLADCPTAGGLPSVFPTPEVTLSPRPAKPSATATP